MDKKGSRKVEKFPSEIIGCDIKEGVLYVMNRKTNEENGYKTRKYLKYMNDELSGHLHARRLPKEVSYLGIIPNRFVIKDEEILALYYTDGQIPKDVLNKLLAIYDNVITFKNKLYSHNIFEYKKDLKNILIFLNSNKEKLWIPLGRIALDIRVRDTKIDVKIDRFDAYNMIRGGGNLKCERYISSIRI
jgi:hypothetical protein